jgi:hypothetical protein
MSMCGLPEQIWIEHSLMACQNYWSLDPDTSYAVGSRTRWCGMRDMAVGDVIFLPKGPDDGHFMVTTVKYSYTFDRATVVKDTDV